MRFGKLDPDSLLISGYETVPIRHRFSPFPTSFLQHFSYVSPFSFKSCPSFNSLSTGFLGPLDIKCSQTDIKCS